MTFWTKHIFLSALLSLLLFQGYVFGEDAKLLLKKDEGFAVPGHKEMGCMACHRTAPKSFESKDRTELLTEDLNSLCRRCHNSVAVVREGHHLEPTPYTEKELISELDKLKLPLSKEGITCVTCHDPHAKLSENFFLKAEYVEFSNKAKWINPHWSETLCAACHAVRPVNSKELNFKFEGNFIKMCNICHDTVSAESLEHSVGMVPSLPIKGRMPKEFALSKNGEVTCITCHELKYQCLKEEFNKKGLNPLFFRGGPYASRTDICYKCHASAGYERLNPHDQINDEGEMLKDRCLYCHADVPDPKKNGKKRGRFQLDGNLKGLCQRCHRDRPHPGGSLARATFDHIVRPSNETLAWKIKSESEQGVILPLEPGIGRVYCCTCHNPHERGIQRRGASDKGADVKQRLRLDGGYNICSACHGWNK